MEEENGEGGRYELNESPPTPDAASLEPAILQTTQYSVGLVVSSLASVPAPAGSPTT